ncbi:retropepsin-like aspartic protease [Seonamhaeicola maritimus]|uniref:Aspartyl protease n=1 Tax=Seonamhaeicola maritimus TaxID=2591822 RepID=A0A5C7GM65_9FLAO|nr:retropepsin-like aspartic protease [Seonamhaeicola maritimus]TXG39433.1 hypothetical protein FUA22_06045 [Seonamhaeicola maritimus]
MYRILLSICFYLSLTTLIYAQKSYFKTGKTTSKNYYTEIEYENVRDKIIIPVSINGKSYRFLFDTGAPNLVSKEILSSINFKKSRSLSVTDANQKKQRMDLVSLPNLTIGNVTFKNTSALVFNGKDNLVFDCFEVDGIIGSNLLRKSIVKINSKKQIIILTNDVKKLTLKKEHASKLTLVGNQSSPYIYIKLKGEHSGNENLLLDTGASGFYDLSKNNYKVLQEKKIVEVISKANGSSSVGMFGVAEKSEQYRLKIPELIINNQVFQNVITTTGDDNNSRIGSDILKYGNITLDFVNKLFYLDVFETENDLNEKLYGFSPTIVNNKLTVGFVWEDTLKDQIEFGDEIIEIDGVNFQNKEVCDFLVKPSVFGQKERLNVKIKNKTGEIVNIILKKEYYGERN